MYRIKDFWFFAVLIVLLLFSPFGKIIAQFQLNGTAIQVNDSCYQLTPATDFVAGSIWNLDKINLNESFQVIMDLNFGCKDMDGADGIVFGFQPVSTSIGEAGEGIGFQGVSPSIGIEFDTWQNLNLFDPTFDHIAIIKNGDLNHNTSNTVAGPVQANAANPNIEDCNFHALRVNWDAEKHLLEVFFDCTLRLSYTGDIVNDIFNGDPNVFWGFTSATGGANNVQEVCFSYTTFLNGFEDVTICPGGQFKLNVSGGVSYKWTPSTGLSNPNIPDPIAAPLETTTYSVEVLDDCGNPFFDTITVAIDGDTVFFDLGVDTTVCEGQRPILDATSFGNDTVTYIWSNEFTEPTIQVDSPGLYAVTVTVDQFCVSDDRVNIDFLPLPKVALGQDTTLCFDQSLLLDASFPGATYLWQDSSTSPDLLVFKDGLYSVQVSSFCGVVEDEISVGFEDCQQVYFPNAFSPNADGVNDYFLPFDGGDVTEITVFKIFNRWGSLVYEASGFLPNDTTFGWDGTFRGKDADAGVYAWFAEIIFKNGKRELRKGDVMLVR